MLHVKHLLIVGASRGLGLALVKQALSESTRVTSVVRNAHDLPQELRQHPKLNVLKADVRSEEQLARAARQLPDGLNFDGLIYNAAVHLERDGRDIEQTASDPIVTTINVNAVGALRTVKHFRRFVQPGGIIAIISSEAGNITDSKRTSEYGYCMSKAALNMFTRLLANREQHLATGVQVFSVHPGWMRTDMGGPQAELDPEEVAKTLLATFDKRLTAAGPEFIDRFGQPMNW